ncbi:MAG: squalene--hopene cyclase [Candidatus Xenobium sp.]|jgi:squalene-hopene/tetraprenyl-beta-curcumene cyclase|nr:squalene--hopene cyclase [Burkholderiales bacterium]
MTHKADSREWLDKGIEKALRWLEQNQTPQGYWAGFMKTNSAIEAEWILAMHFLGIHDDPKYPEVVRSILSEQRPDGSWEIFHGAPAGDISATVECYAALRAAGLDKDSQPLTKARTWILEHGGLGKVRVFTRIWLALLGEWPWDATPNLPPELVFLPSWAPLNLYDFASWGRATIVALCLVSVKRPVRPLPADRRLDELFPHGRKAQDYSLPRPKTPVGWFFFLGDRLLNLYHRSPFQPGRDMATKLCIEWMVRRQEADGCWAGIQPPWIYALIGLNCHGYALDHPVMKAGLEAFNEPWAYPTEKGTYLQCCTSPVWDTMLSLLAMTDCGVDCQNPSVQKGLDYLLDQQIDAPGDWQVKVRGVPSGSWSFEYENDTYPDIDDTAVAMMALARLRDSSADPARVDQALERATLWILGMRSRNGAWAAFDVNNDSALVSQIPFSDFGESLDPPSADVTAHVIEALGNLGRDMTDPVVARAVDYLRAEQEDDGSWFGRWGVNYIYGTGLVVPALKAVGENMQADYIQKAADWIVSRQNPDGGWGETCSSYMDPSLRGVGTSTSSQTGWALLALLAIGDHERDEAIGRGLNYLLETQRPDGTWDQPEYTGTGFPGYGRGVRTDLKTGQTLDQGKELSRGFMLNYAMYRHYFPLMALGRARRHLEE